MRIDGPDKKFRFVNVRADDPRESDPADGDTGRDSTETRVTKTFNQGWEGGVLHVWYSLFGFNDEPPSQAGQVVDEIKRRWEASCGSASSSLSWEASPGASSIEFRSTGSVTVDLGTTEEDA